MLLVVQLVALLSFNILRISAAPLNTTTAIVDLGYARYHGIVNTTSGVTSYLGLRYAAPPVGARRWQPPIGIEQVTVNKSGSIIDATTHGPQCYQFVPAWAGSPDHVLGSEDCLLLDVLVPNSPQSARLPVVVQIHGGGYDQGRSNSSDGTEFVRYSNGSIIYVQIQYRLGPYGFLAAPAVRANGTANAGLLDQKEALAWVQRNIGKFGGDASRVTIWGNSAGGGSVSFQLVLHGGDPSPPFHAAIPDFPWWQPFKDDTILTAQYDEILVASGCTDLGCLRDLNSTALYNASQRSLITGYEAGYYGFGDFYYGPAVDGVSILSLPSNEYALGHYARVPMLVDHDAYEGVVFTNVSTIAESQVEPDLKLIWPLANQSFFDALFQQYPQSAFTSNYTSDPIIGAYTTAFGIARNDSAFYQRQAAYGDFIISCPTWYMTSALMASNISVYKLRFAAGTQLHGATIPFLLNPNDAQGNFPNSTISAYMKDYWLSFILTGDPNTGFSSESSNTVNGSRPHWPSYSEGGGTVLSINQTSIGSILDYDAGPRCQFFKENTAVVRN